jgi:hypothetical protein
MPGFGYGRPLNIGDFAGTGRACKGFGSWSHDQVRVATRRENSYLKNHPDAQDTKEGILEWWLLHQRAESIENALAELVDRRFLDSFTGPDAKVHYRIAANRQDDFLRPCKSMKKHSRS